MNTLPPTREGVCEKTWVPRGLSACAVELTRGDAQGGLVAFNFRDRRTLMSDRNRWRLERQREIPAHTFGYVSNLSLDAKPEKPVRALGTTSVADGHQFSEAMQVPDGLGMSRPVTAKRHPHETGSNFSGLCIARLGWVRQRSVGRGMATQSSTQTPAVVGHYFRGWVRQAKAGRSDARQVKVNRNPRRNSGTFYSAGLGVAGQCRSWLGYTQPRAASGTIFRGEQRPGDARPGRARTGKATTSPGTVIPDIFPSTKKRPQTAGQRSKG